MNKNGVSIAIPIYNNGSKIYPVLSTLAYTLQHDYEIIVVYDDENDPTLSTIDDLIFVNNNIIKIKNSSEGPVSAIITAIEKAKYCYFGIWMSYHIDPEGKINDMVKLLDEGADLVSANRFSSKKTHGRGFYVKVFFSKWGNFFISLLAYSHLHDFTTSIKIFRLPKLKEILHSNSFNYSGWSILTFWTLNFVKNKFIIKEVNFYENNLHFVYGKSKFKILKSLQGYIYCLKLALFIYLERKSN